MFDGCFAEAEQGHAKLHDVSPWVFRTFVGWLYYQNIFYDAGHKRRRRFPTQRSPGQPKSKATKAKAKANGDARNGGNNDSLTQDSAIDLTSEETPQKTPNQNTSKIRDTSEESASKSETSSDRKVRQPSPTGRHPPGGNDRKYSQEDEVTYGSKDSAEDECNYHEPITWPFEWLFELYVFSEKYDIRDFRVSIFEIIQMKFFQEQPRRYLLPDSEDLIYALENLPPRSPLYRLLVDCWGKWLTLTSSAEADREAQAEDFDNLPAHFLSRCLVAMKRCEGALFCDKCGLHGTGEKCNSKKHSVEDRLDPPYKDYCTYHEHGDDDQEKARCVLRWESRRHLLEER